MFKSQVGSFVSPAAPGLLVVPLDPEIWEGEGPKIIICWYAGVTSDGIVTGAKFAFGIADETGPSVEASVMVTSEHGQPSSNADRSQAPINLLRLIDFEQTVLELGDISSSGPNEFVVEWFTTETAPNVYHFQAWGGDTLTEVDLRGITAPPATGPVSYDIGFEPTGQITFGVQATPGEKIQSFSTIGIGFTDGTNQFAISSASPDGLPTSFTGRTQVDDKIYVSLNNNGPIIAREIVSWKSFDTLGFTWDWEFLNATGRVVAVLSFAGPVVKVISDTERPTPGVKLTPLGQVPGAGLLLTFMGDWPLFTNDVAAGAVGQSVTLNGIDQFIQTDFAELPAYPFSVSCWLKATSTGIGAAFWMGDKTDIDAYAVINTTSTGTAAFGIRIGSTSEIDSGVQVDDGIWHHVVAIARSATDREIYVDGVTEGTSADSKAIPLINRATFGRFDDSTPDNEFEGPIDEVRIFDDVLTTDEVTFLYNSHRGVAGGTDPTAANLVGHWNLNNDLRDVAPAANDGTPSIEADARLGLGALDAAGNQRFIGSVDEHGEPTTNSARVQDSSNVLSMIDHDQNVLSTARGEFIGTTISLDWAGPGLGADRWAGIFVGDIAVPTTQSEFASEVLRRARLESETTRRATFATEEFSRAKFTDIL